MSMQAVLAWDIKAELGEGPMWSPRDNALWFVDINKGHLHRHSGTSQTSYEIGGRPSFVFPRAAGGLLVGSGHDLLHVEDGGVVQTLATVDMHGGNRTNDATTDSDGRLWFGTMDDGESEPHGRVYRYDGAIAEMGGACTVTNGPAISSDGRTLYHVDTLAGTIWKYALGACEELRDGTVFAQIDPADGWPDGVTVDAEGCVWVGLWNGWAARRYDARGKLVGEVVVPCANVTKVAFGGPDLTTGYITTARKGLSNAALAEQPVAGGLFSFAAPAPGNPVVPVREAAASKFEA